MANRARVVMTLVAICWAVADVPVAAQMRTGLWLEVFVQAEDGTPITDLGPGDFLVEQGGALSRTIDAELVDSPLRFVLLVEESTRIAAYLIHIRNGLSQFVDHLPEGSEVAVVLFATRPRTVAEATSDRAAVKEGFGHYFASRDANANVFHAVEETVDRLYRDYAESPVVVVVTGDATTDVPRRRIQQVVEQLAETGTTVHTLVLNTLGGTRWTGVARTFSEFTGGTVEEVNSPSFAVVRKLRELAALVAARAAARPARYVVTFQPPADTDPAAEVAVAVRRSQARVEVRAQLESRGR